MVVAPPVAGFGPVAERSIFVVPEALGTPGTIPTSAGATYALATFKPSDKITGLKNEAWYGDMGDIHGNVQGTEIGGFDAGGPHFGDVWGHVCRNLLGDYTTTGTAASPASTASAPIAAGATTITVASGGASFTPGMNLWIEDAGSPPANEVVTVLSSTATTITLTAPTRFAHLTAVPFTNTTAPFTHVFALLNTLASVGNGPGQPVTHTWTDRTNIPATGLAAQYAYSCFSEATLTGNAEQFVMWEGKATSLIRSIAATPPVPAPGSTQPLPAWRSTVKLTPVGGGSLTQINDFGEWAVSLHRQVKPYFTASGQQAPYMIARGKQGATVKISVSPAIDEQSILHYLANDQPQIQILTTNGLAGTLVNSTQIDIGLAAAQSADITDASELFGFDNEYTAIHSGATFNGVTLTGQSGGQGCVKVTMINATPTY